MKRLILLTVLMMLTVSYGTAKEKSVSDEAKKELKANVNKDSRKVAKDMEKDGWKVMPGRVTLEKQIERSQIAEVSLDRDGKNLFILGTHKATGGNYSAAKSIASVRAKGELASQLQSNIKRSIMDKNSSKQVSSDDIQLLDETISAILESVDVDMAGVNNLLEIYRESDGGKCEVMITLSVSAKMLVDSSVEKVRQELEGKTNLLFK